MELTMGIDLSLRSTGICISDGKKNTFHLITPSTKEYNDEYLLIFISQSINDIIKNNIQNIKIVNLEGLSFGSLTGSKDILAGNFWYVRTQIYRQYPSITVNIIPVLSWRSPLFTKADRKEMKEANDAVKKLKAKMKGKPRKEQSQATIDNEDIIRAADIKEQTFLKLPVDIQQQILSITESKARYDLSDSFFLANHRV